jgi:Ca2+-binding RTX toxin-like protein
MPPPVKCPEILRRPVQNPLPLNHHYGILAAFAEATLRADRVTFRGSGDNLVRGISGADLVVAGHGDDRVLGAGGNDVVLAGPDNDTSDGGAGSDLLIGGRGRDMLKGAAGSDLLAGNADDDILGGGGGNDILLLGTGVDRASGNTGNDLLIVTDDALAGFNRASGGPGGTLRLEVSATVFAVAAFQAEIGAFEPGEVTILSSIGLRARDVERLEVHVDGTRAFAAGLAAADQGAAARALLHDADLWGLM